VQECPFDVRVCIYAAEAGQLPALRFAHERAGQVLNPSVAYAAAAWGNLGCLVYMVEKVRAHNRIHSFLYNRSSKSVRHFFFLVDVNLAQAKKKAARYDIVQGCKMTPLIAGVAASRGAMSCLQ